MILSYQSVFEEDAERRRIKAEITTEHPTSSYGQPVIVLEDGGSLDLVSWLAMGYKVEKATKGERADLQKMGLL